MSQSQTYDVIVVGGGNAGFSAAISAQEHGAKNVLLLEKAPESWAGGNTTFTAGAYRTAFSGLDDVLPLVTNVDSELAKQIDLPPYTEDDFLADLKRVTEGKCDEQLARVLVNESADTTKWLAANGVKFLLSFHRQAYKIGERYKFWGGLALAVEDHGKGLTRMHQNAARSKGIEVRYESPVVGLLADDAGAARGVRIKHSDGKMYEAYARGGVILCAGGFESSPELRAKYLGPGWDKAYVRGTPYNTGDLLALAVDELGAAKAGDWSGCHSTCWDANAPKDVGDQLLTNQFTKSGYPLGLMINVEGKRFVDEGVDMRNYTYAKFGREILKQPDSVCFQVWDAVGTEWLRKEEYAPEVVDRLSANSIVELAQKLSHKGLKSPDVFVETLEDYNVAVDAYRKETPDAKFDPSKKDGLSTRSSKGGLALDKTNWALPILKAPFLAVKITTGVTFSFGGLRIDPTTAAVMHATSRKSIDGLFCAGEMVGGLFYENYPGGSGLTQGAVFGRKAGMEAARRAARLASR